MYFEDYRSEIDSERIEKQDTIISICIFSYNLKHLNPSKRG